MQNFPDFVPGIFQHLGENWQDIARAIREHSCCSYNTHFYLGERSFLVQISKTLEHVRYLK